MSNGGSWQTLTPNLVGIDSFVISASAAVTTAIDYDNISASNFRTAPDSTAPTLDGTNSTPLDNATAIAIDANLVIDFTEDVAFDSAGTITLRNLASGSTVETFTVSGGSATGSVGGTASISADKLTLNPNANLLAGTDYSVQFSAGAIKDIADNGLAAISNDTTYNFTTAAPTVTLSATGSPIAENGGSANVTATLSAAASADTTVTLTPTGTATGSGTDFTLASTTITILAGATTGTTTVTAAQDELDEGVETVILDISGVSGGGGATESGTQTATVAILDDDPLPTVSIANTSLTEGNSDPSNMTFTVTLSPVSGRAVSVNYATSDGTATTADSDYTAASGTLTFAAGETSKTFTVAINGDTTFEPNETITATLTAPTNATLGTATATGTITNDESIPPVAGFGTVLTLDGVDGYAQATTPWSALNINAAGDKSTITLAAWVKPDYSASLAGDAWEIVSLSDTTLSPGDGDDKTDYLGFRINQTTKKLLVGIDNADPWTSVLSTDAVTEGVWSHVAAVMDGNSITFYINGVASGGGTLEARVLDGMDKLTMGALDVVQGPNELPYKAGHFKGSMDEVQAWSTALTAEQVQAWRLGVPDGNEANLAGVWRFGESSGTSSADGASNAHPATLLGGASLGTSYGAIDVYATEDTAFTLPNLPEYDPDNAAVTFSLVSNDSGAAVLTSSANGAITYTPAANLNGVRTFTYKVNDGTSDSAVQTVNVNITAVNDAPTLTNDATLTAID